MLNVSHITLYDQTFFTDEWYSYILPLSDMQFGY